MQREAAQLLLVLRALCMSRGWVAMQKPEKLFCAALTRGARQRPLVVVQDRLLYVGRETHNIVALNGWH